MQAAERDTATRRERTRALTEVRSGTPMGEYLRRFWYPVAFVSDLDRWPVKQVQLLAETLALYRGDDGAYGLVADRCPHRGASLACGMTEGASLRCAYHGWAFDRDGR